MARHEGILILSCGGTFDKSRFTRSGKFVCGDPLASRILEGSGAEDLHEVGSVIKKDSLDMDDADRDMVREAVAGAAQKRVVVVHGTDTMVTTARHLDGAAPGKTVVLVGAMSPAVFRDSDAEFNLGFALGYAASAPAGVWVAMHGRAWLASEVRKDTDKMRFVDEG